MKRVIGEVVDAGETHVRIQSPGIPTHQAGQFAMLQLGPGGTRLDPLLPRPMAIYRRSGDVLEFRFKRVGRGTQLLSELPPGARVSVLGPLGNGFRRPAGRSLLIGGGTGIASLYELARDAPGPTRVRLGGQSHADLLGLADFEQLSVALEVTTEDGSHGAKGRVTDGLVPASDEEVFACGPPGMLRAAQHAARSVGARCWVALESPMACGFGVCLGCVVPTRGGLRYVCTHGPVFDARAIDWETAA